MPNAQEYLNQMPNKVQLTTLDLSKKSLSGEVDLSEFTNLVSIRANENDFTDCDWLFTLPAASKSKLKWLNLGYNQIESVDFARLFTDFPSLVSINLENNPLSGKNLKDLDNQQFSQLVSLVEDEKLRLNSEKGTLLVDLLEYNLELRLENDKLKQQRQAQVEVAPKK